MSVEMLTFLFENNFSSQEIWEYLENYFLGIIPEEVKISYSKRIGKNSEIKNMA